MESFVYARLINYPCFEWERSLVLQWTPLWSQLRSSAAIAALVQTVERTRRTLLVETVHWAPYMRHVLYEQPESLLYDSEKWLGPESAQHHYDIVPVGFDDNKDGGGGGASRDKAYWVALLTRYRHENPNAEEYSKTVLIDRPHDYELLSSRTLSFVALDRRRENRMAGYVTCTLRALHQPAPKDAPPFKSPELNKLNARLRQRASSGGNQQQQQDAGYDAFSVDGVHVHVDNRGEPGAAPLSKILVFYALEFIRLAHPVLGVTLLIAGAEAAPTKAILGGTFGFSHFNLQKDLQWLYRRLKDFWSVRRGRGAPTDKTDTPLALLTRLRLAQAVEGVREKVPDPAEDRDGGQRYKYELARLGHQDLADFLDETARKLRESLKRQPAADPDLARRRPDILDDMWPADAQFWTPQQFHAQLLVPLREYREAVAQDEELGQPYMKRVNTLLDTGDDNQDCFLWLGSGGGPGGGQFEKKMLDFYDLYRANKSASEDSNWVEDLEEWRDRRDSSSPSSSASGGRDMNAAAPTSGATEMPTEQDMRLYALWLSTPIPDPSEASAGPYGPEGGGLDAQLRRIDQAYLDAQRAYARDVEDPLVQAQARAFFALMRPNSPKDWSDERVMALARSSARFDLAERGTLAAFVGRAEWVALHYPQWVRYYR